MKLLAWILSIVGGICGILGIIAGIIAPLLIGTKGMTAGWWLILSAVFLLATIATNQFRKVTAEAPEKRQPEAPEKKT